MKGWNRRKRYQLSLTCTSIVGLIMNLIAKVFSSCILLGSVVTIFCESNDGKCTSLVGGPFDICTKAGYNNTLPLREEVTDKVLSDLAAYLPIFIRAWENCSSVELVAAMECSFYFPKCNSEGMRVLPCRRVCGELLKHCLNYSSQDFREILRIFFLFSAFLYQMKQQAARSVSSHQILPPMTACLVSTSFYSMPLLLCHFFRVTLS